MIKREEKIECKFLLQSFGEIGIVIPFLLRADPALKSF